MSKLDVLIAELCPDGVEYVELNEVLDYEQPTKYIVKSTNYDDSYTIPVLTAGQSFVLGYTNEDFGIYKASPDSPVIIFDDFTTSFHWVDFNFKVKSSAMKMLRSKDNEIANLRFLFHLMKNINYIPVDHSRQWIGKYSKFRIPLPPLPVQQEIVRILDNFTELTAELIAELTTELTARRKQYEYYRDLLLTFGDEVPRVKLGHITTITRGVRVVKRQLSEIGTYPVFQNSVTPLGYYEKNNYPKNTVFVIGAGAAGEIGYSKVDFWAADDCFCLTCSDILQSRFLYYALLCQKDYLLSRVRRASVPRLARSVIEELKIPVPPLEEQERIVAILDRIDDLCNDLTSGIPAEIEARQKQYEYYRDKLLTFKEVSA
jgi:type I restriction enzyme S subunit